MKHLIFWLMLLAAPAFAQDKPAAKEAAKPEAIKEAEKKDRPKQAAATPRKPGKRWNEDARHCLERPTNTEIIKCAEEYL